MTRSTVDVLIRFGREPTRPGGNEVSPALATHLDIDARVSFPDPNHYHRPRAPLPLPLLLLLTLPNNFRANYRPEFSQEMAVTTRKRARAAAAAAAAEPPFVS